MGRLSALFMNPVLGKEIKLRFRSFKSFIGILFYLVVLAAVALAFIYMESLTANYGGFQAGSSRMLFIILTVVQMMLIAFMAPGLTAGAVSGERERQTLNILLTTKQTSGAIILSKLFSSLAYLALMVVSSLPLYALVFLYGGVSPQMVLSTFGIFLLTMFTFGSIGVLFSTLIRKTIVAMITTYGVALFLIAGSAFLFIFFQAFWQTAQYSGTISATQQPIHVFPYIMAAIDPLIVLISMFAPGYFGDIVRDTGIHIPLWQTFLEIYLFLAILALWFAILRLRPRMKGRNAKGIEEDD